MTAVWLSAAVLKTCFRSVGIVVLRLDELRHHAAHGFDAERQRRDVEQQHVLHFAGEHAALNRRADGHDFVRVHALVRLFAEDLLDELLHLGNARRTADEHDFVDLARLQLGVLQRLQHRAAAALDQADRPAARTWLRVMFICKCFGPAGIGRDERQVDVGRAGRAEFLLGLFARFLQPLQGHRVLAQIDALAPS